MKINPAQSRAARALLDWSRHRLAAESNVSYKTLADFETGARLPYDRTLRDVIDTFANAGIEFIGGEAPGVRLRGNAR